MKFFNKRSNKDKFNQNQLNSAVKLFEHTSVSKALLRVVFLAVVVAFASGLYVFADQVLMQKILPYNNSFVSKTLASIGWDDVKNIAQKYSTYENESKVINEITRLVNAGNSPITMICAAISLMIGLGSAIIYSKALGSKDEKKIKDIWKNSFYNCLVTSLVTTIIVIGLIYVIIPAEIKTSDSFQNDPQMSEFIKRLQEKSREYAIAYCLILVGFNIFNNYLMYFVSLLNSEGKNSVPTIIVLISNGINILVDWLLLNYSEAGIYGSAIATIISYVVSIFIFGGYLSVKNKHNDTYMIYKDLSLKNYKIDWSIMGGIYKVGVSSFFRNAATAIFSIVQLSIYANITGKLTAHEATYYTSIMGAVTPIYNLFFSAIIGIIRGARTVISYNHGRNNVENIRKAFWISSAMALGYGILFFIIAGPLLTSGDYAGGGFLALFEITPSSDKWKDAVIILNINTAQLALYAFLISGMLYFQAVAKPIQALITSIVYGIILGIPILYILSAISVATSNIMIYQFAPIIISLVSGIPIFGYTVWYIYKKADKPSKGNIDEKDLSINA